MAAQKSPAMDLKSFEALQKATVAHAVQHGVNRPVYIDLATVPADIMELQIPYARAVLTGQTKHASFEPEFSPEQGEVARTTLVGALRAYWKGRT